MSIFDAAKDGDTAQVKRLLKNNPDLVLSKDALGETPLHWAALWGQISVAELLLANNSKVNAKDNTGNTPLHDAEINGHTEMVEFLRHHAGQDTPNVHQELRQTFMPVSPSIRYDDKSTTATDEEVWKLIQLNGGIENFRGAINVYKEQLHKLWPDASPELLNQFFSNSNLTDMLALAIPIYKKHFSNNEIKQLIAFQESTLGKEVAHEMPDITKEFMVVSDQWGERVGERIQKQLQAANASKPSTQQISPTQATFRSPDTASINQEIQLFEAQEGRFPIDLNELVTKQYLGKLPEVPTGMQFNYDAVQGQVSLAGTPQPRLYTREDAAMQLAAQGRNPSEYDLDSYADALNNPDKYPQAYNKSSQSTAQSSSNLSNNDSLGNAATPVASNVGLIWMETFLGVTNAMFPAEVISAKPEVLKVRLNNQSLSVNGKVAAR